MTKEEKLKKDLSEVNERINVLRYVVDILIEEFKAIDFVADRLILPAFTQNTRFKKLSKKFVLELLNELQPSSDSKSKK